MTNWNADYDITTTLKVFYLLILCSQVPLQSEAAAVDPCSLLSHQSRVADVPSCSLDESPEVALSVHVGNGSAFQHDNNVRSKDFTIGCPS